MQPYQPSDVAVQLDVGRWRGHRTARCLLRRVCYLCPNLVSLLGPLGRFHAALVSPQPMCKSISWKKNYAAGMNLAGSESAL